MNKFALVFCLILIVNFSQEVEINVNFENVYNYLINILKGLSSTNENKCANVLISNKSRVLSIVQSLIDELKSGKKFGSLITSYSTKLLSIKNLGNDCRIFHLIPVFNKMLSLEGIKGIGDRILKNAKTLYDYIEKLKTVKGLADKLVYVGKCLKIILNIYVN